MRATINFDIDVDKVQETMKALVKAETDNIRSAAHNLATGDGRDVEKTLKTSLEMLKDSVRQLEQYENMLASFARARYETIIPQSIPEDEPSPHNVLENMRQAIEAQETMKKFDRFIENINSEAADESRDEEG